MNEDLETISTPEIVKIWCDEYARTTPYKATVVKEEGDWIYIKTPSHEGQPWQRCHLIRAIQTLRTRPDYGASIYSEYDFRAGDANERTMAFAESPVIAVA